MDPPADERVTEGRPETQDGGMSTPSRTTVYASFGPRLGALLIDALILWVVSLLGLGLVVALSAVAPDAFALSLLLSLLIGVPIAYFVYFEGLSGQTIGKRLLGVRVVDIYTRDPIGYRRALIRALVKWVSAIPLYLGYLWMLWDGSRQTWQDKAASSVVIQTRPDVASAIAVETTRLPTGARLNWRLVAWLAFVGLVALAGYLSTFFGSDPPDDVLYEYTTAAAILVQSAIFIGILLLIGLGLSKRPLFGLRSPRSWGGAIGWVAVGLGAVWAMNLALSPFLDAGEEQGLLPDEWDPDRLGGFIAVGLMITFVGPITEEFMFRGVGFALLEPYGKWVTIVVTGVLFGALHGLLIALPILAAFGVILGWLRWRTASVYPCILLHVIFNGIAIASVPLVA